MLHQPPVAFLAPLQCLLRLLAFGHVASDQREAAQLTLGVAQSRDDRIGPQRRAVLAQPPAFFLKAALGLRQLQSLLRLPALDVFGKVETGKMAADDFAGPVTLDQFRTGVPTGYMAFGIEHDNGVVLHPLDQHAEAFLAFPQRMLDSLATRSFLPQVQRPLHRGYEARQPVFQNVIRCAAFERFRRHFLPLRTGDENEGNVRTLVPGDGQRRESMERWKAVVGENQLRRIMLKLTDEILAGVHALAAKGETAFAQFTIDQLYVISYVFQDQDAQFFIQNRQHGFLLLSILSSDLSSKKCCADVIFVSVSTPVHKRDRARSALRMVASDQRIR